MPISHFDMRSAVLAALATGNPPRDFETFKYEVARMLMACGHMVENAHGNQYLLRAVDWRAYHECIWELITENVLAPGFDSSNESWPYLALTQYGARAVEGANATPHASAEFVRTLAAVRPLDDVEYRFVVQALETFRRGLWDASAVMIGSASEHLIEVLMHALAVHDRELATIEEALANRPAVHWVRECEKYLFQRRKALPRPLAQDPETMFVSLAVAIRVARNEGGHPSAGEPVDRERAYAGLELYRIFRRSVCLLLDALPLTGSGI